MGTKAERRQARERVAAYHEACLGQLVAHVANVLDGYRAGELDAYAVDETIHHYHRAAGQLWKFCWASGSSTHLELIAASSTSRPPTVRPPTGGKTAHHVRADRRHRPRRLASR